MHLFLVGSHRTDRSGLIQRLLALCPADMEVQGYVTEKREPDGAGNCPIYLHPLGMERRYTEENLIGLCRNQRAAPHPEGFERYAPILSDLPRRGVIVLDELGVMESEAPAFRLAVLSVLDTAPLVLASVRDKDTPFLERVRRHHRARCVPIGAGKEGECFAELATLLMHEIGICRT